MAFLTNRHAHHVVVTMLTVLTMSCSNDHTSPTPQPSTRVTLTGTVSAAVSGRVIQDVRVRIVAGVNVGRETLTDGAGVYTLQDLVPGAMTLMFTSSGYVDLQRSEAIRADTTLDVRLERGPEPGFVLSGRVTTMWGEAIGDVGVEAVNNGRVFGGGTTDRNGVYSIPTLPAQDYVVRAIKFGYLTPQLPVTLAANTTLDIQLDRVRVAITGFIDEAAPCIGAITGARIEILDGPDTGRVTTSGSGGYSLQNINWGAFTLRASKDGYTPVSVSMTVQPPGSGNPPAPQTVQQNFRLSRTGSCP